MRPLALLATLLLLLALPAQAAPDFTPDLNGRWIVGEADGDHFDVILEVYGTAAAISPVSDSPGDMQLRNGQVDLSAAPFYPITIQANLKPVQNGYILLQSENGGIMWLNGEAKLMRIRRLGTLVPALQGTWTVARAAAGEPTTMTVSAASVSFPGAQGIEKAKLFPLAPDGDTIDMVLVPANADSVLFHFQPMADGSVLVWQEIEDTYRVLYQGQRPAWITDVQPVAPVQ